MYSIIDIESNGAGFRQESIIDIAIYRFDGHRIVDQFFSLVNPEAGITPYVQKLTKITPKMVKTAPKFHEIAKRVVEITENSTLVGHNIDFDYRMLRQSFSRLGYEFKINTLDTIPLAQKLIPEAESYSLGKLVKSVGIPITDQHRAAGDARATLELFKLLLNKDLDNEIIQKQFDETNSKSYANRVRELTQDLPNERGIAYFQAADGEILHIKFADSINRYAKKVFNSKLAKLKKVQAETAQIHYDIVGNELLAGLILSSKGIAMKSQFPYGLYIQHGKYAVGKCSQREDSPLLKFASYTQATKVLRMIKTSPEYFDSESISSKLNFNGKSALFVFSGRRMGEMAFLIMENSEITGYGFYELYHQIEKKSALDQLKINVKDPNPELLNRLKLMILSGDAKEMPLPE